MCIRDSNSQAGSGGSPATLLKLRGLFPGAAIIVVARCRSLAAAVEFFRAGAVDYLPAPLSREELRERLYAALTRRERPATVEVEMETSAGDKPLTAAGMENMLPLSAIPCGLLLFNAEGALIAANRLALSLLGETDTARLAEAIRHHFEDWDPLDGQGRPLRPEAWPPRRALQEKAARAALVGLRRPDRTRVWLRLEAAPIIHNGRCQEIAMAMVNVTEEHSEIRRLKARLAGCSAAT